MALSREELLLLILYTSPTEVRGYPAIFGSTRAQKLVFLATREFAEIQAITSTEYEFVPYDYGPYSSDLEQDLRPLMEAGLIDSTAAAILEKDPSELTLAELTSFKKKRRRQADPYVLKGPRATEVHGILTRLDSEGVDIRSLLETFREVHEKFGTLELDALLTYVYEKYPHMASKTKRTELLPASLETNWDEEDDEDDE